MDLIIFDEIRLRMERSFLGGGRGWSGRNVR